MLPALFIDPQFLATEFSARQRSVASDFRQSLCGCQVDSDLRIRLDTNKMISLRFPTTGIRKADRYLSCKISQGKLYVTINDDRVRDTHH